MVSPLFYSALIMCSCFPFLADISEEYVLHSSEICALHPLHLVSEVNAGKLLHKSTFPLSPSSEQ